MPGAFQVEVQADIFIGGVGLRARVTDAGRSDRYVQVLLDDVIRA